MARSVTAQLCGQSAPLRRGKDFPDFSLTCQSPSLSFAFLHLEGIEKENTKWL